MTPAPKRIGPIAASCSAVNDTGWPPLSKMSMPLAAKARICATVRAERAAPVPDTLTASEAVSAMGGVGEGKALRDGEVDEVVGGIESIDAAGGEGSEVRAGERRAGVAQGDDVARRQHQGRGLEGGGLGQREGDGVVGGIENVDVLARKRGIVGRGDAGAGVGEGDGVGGGEGDAAERRELGLGQGQRVVDRVERVDALGAQGLHIEGGELRAMAGHGHRPAAAESIAPSAENASAVSDQASVLPSRPRKPPIPQLRDPAASSSVSLAPASTIVTRSPAANVTPVAAKARP